MFGALNYDNFLLGPDDIASGTESNVSDNDSDENSEEFEFNDMYIEDDINSFLNLDPEHDSDLDHYLLGPDGIYLDEISDVSFDSIAGLDPEPSPGPVDPG